MLFFQHPVRKAAPLQSVNYLNTHVRFEDFNFTLLRNVDLPLFYQQRTFILKPIFGFVAFGQLGSVEDDESAHLIPPRSLLGVFARLRHLAAFQKLAFQHRHGKPPLPVRRAESILQRLPISHQAEELYKLLVTAGSPNEPGELAGLQVEIKHSVGRRIGREGRQFRVSI